MSSGMGKKYRYCAAKTTDFALIGSILEIIQQKKPILIRLSEFETLRFCRFVKTA